MVSEADALRAARRQQVSRLHDEIALLKYQLGKAMQRLEQAGCPFVPPKELPPCGK